MTVPEIQTVARKTGRAELDEHARGVNVSEIEAPFELGKRSKREVVNEIRTKLNTIPGVNVEIGQPISHRIDAMLSGTQANIAIKLFGTDLNKMFELGNKIKSEVSEIPGVVDINVEQKIERQQLKIITKRGTFLWRPLAERCRSDILRKSVQQQALTPSIARMSPARSSFPPMSPTVTSKVQ